MKTGKLLACLLAVLLLTITVLPTAFADFVFSDEDEKLSGTYDATVFLAGEEPANSADVNGIIFAAGKTVSSDGSGEYAMLAGNVVTLAGTVSRDAFLAGNSIIVTGDCERDMVVAGQSVEIRGSVGRDLMVFARSVVISGHVGGNVTINAQTVTITDDAEIEGSITRNDSSEISASEEVLSNVTTTPDEGSVSGETSDQGATSPVVSKLKSKLFTLLGLLLIAFFMLLFTQLWEKVDARFAGKSFGFFAGTFGIGLLILLLLPLASILLMITGVGLRAGFVLLLVFAAALLASPIFLGFFLGLLLWRKVIKRDRSYGAELAIGTLLWTALTAIPRVSLVMLLISAPFGLGALARLLGKKRPAAPASTDLSVQSPAG